MIGVPPGAEPGELDVAFVRRLAELKPRIDRGDPDAINEQRMLHEGFEVLADPARRAHYDKSLAEQFGAPAAKRADLLTDDSGFKRKSRNQTVVLVALLVVLGGVVYKQMSARVESARQEHSQAVARVRAEQQGPPPMQEAEPVEDKAAAAAPPAERPVVAEVREPARAAEAADGNTTDEKK
jgi:DnaJ-class molecular chaperone